MNVLNLCCRRLTFLQNDYKSPTKEIVVCLEETMFLQLTQGNTYREADHISSRKCTLLSLATQGISNKGYQTC